MKKSASILFLILGAGIFVFGMHTASQAAQGEENLSQAESAEQGRRRPIVGPIRRGARAQSNDAAQERMGRAGQLIAASEESANWLRGTGIALFAIGLGSLIFSKKRGH